MAKGQSDKTMLPEKPRVVVGLDFGTEYSGFAFAHVLNPDRIYTFYDYPKSTSEKPYCKTLSACYYKPLAAAESFAGADPNLVGWKLQSWGYPARADYERDIKALHKYWRSQEPPIPNVAGSRNPPSTSSSPGVEKVRSRFKLFSSRHTSQPGASDDIVAPLIPKARSVGGGFLSRLKLFNSQDISQHCASHGVAPQIPQLAPIVGVCIFGFKLHLSRESTEASHAVPLPRGLTVAQVITDYLRELGGLIMKLLQSKYGAHFSSEMVQWCITVPSFWHKATMKSCMAATGLVSAHHPVSILLEMDAALFHCQRLMMGKVVLEADHKLMVSDISSGTYVDSRFIEFLEGRVGQACVSECIAKHRNVYVQLMKEWEYTKSFFDRGQGVTVMNLPSKLAAEWERFDVESGHPGSREYGVLEMSSTEMQSIFDPVVQEYIDHIQYQMVELGGKVRVLALVGGFSESPYLLRKVREAFGAMADIIMCPPNPGSAVCQGAVALALNPTPTVFPRICKRTYGFSRAQHFEKGIDRIERLRAAEDGTQLCEDRFWVFMKKGDMVVMDKPVTTLCRPRVKGCRLATIRLFSIDDGLPPRYITDKRLQEEGKLVMDISEDMELEDRRSIEVSLCLRESSVEVKARAVNFNAEQVQLRVEVDYLFLK